MSAALRPSCAWPSVSLSVTGKPLASTTAWILVVSPPRDGRDDRAAFCGVPQESHRDRKRINEIELRTPCAPPHPLSAVAAQPRIVGAVQEVRRPEKLRASVVRGSFHGLRRALTGKVMPVNPASSVRGPAHSVKRRKTSALDPSEAGALLDSIEI